MAWFSAGAATACAAVGLCCATLPAAASTISFGFNTEFSGGQAPSGPSPWIVATFSDTATPGQVQLTITTSGLTGSENVSGIYFNVNPSLAVTNLVFTSLNGGAGTISASTPIGLGEDAFMADGDGKYDILLTYPVGGGKTFNHTVSSSYDITYSGSGTFNALSFFFMSTPAGGHGPYYAAAHVQNTTGAGSGGSGWVAPVPTAPVPLPAAVWLLLSGLGGLAGFVCTRTSLSS